MHPGDTIAFSLDKLKGISVILSSLAGDIASGASYTDIDKSLRFLSDQVYDTVKDLETVRDIINTAE